jgi:hypothetical protein
MIAEFEDVLRADDVVGVLTRETRVEVVDISGSGCLVESTRPLEVGINGTLRVVIDGRLFGDDVRVVRVGMRPGAGGRCRIGAEFLWTSQPGPTSLRRVASRIRQTWSSRGQEH